MEIRREFEPAQSIQVFADKYGLVMVIRRREQEFWPDKKYYASFANAEIKYGGCLLGACGDGSTERLAIEEYAKEISGHRLVINAMNENRREIDVPELYVGGE